MAKKIIVMMLIIMAWGLGFSASSYAEGAKKTIRLFVPGSGNSRAYLKGRHWIRLTPEQKMEIVEQARRGALKLNAVVALPAEVYIRELDQMFMNAPEVQNIEVGQAIQGVAIAVGDWDDGTDPAKKLEEYVSDANDAG